jgi:hypothetical protein
LLDYKLPAINIQYIEVRALKISDGQIVEEILNQSKSVGSFCKEHELHYGTFCKRLRRMKDKGLIPEDFGSDRANKPTISDTQYKEYSEKGYGVTKISKITGLSESSVTNNLKKLGILNSDRRSKPSGVSRRSRRSSSAEFKDSVKKLRFEEVKGICEICQLQIGNSENWRLATYHHKTPIKNGGDGSKGNCMVIHEDCHKEHFYELHGFSIDYLSNYNKSNKEVFGEDYIESNPNAY